VYSRATWTESSGNCPSEQPHRFSELDLGKTLKQATQIPDPIFVTIYVMYMYLLTFFLFVFTDTVTSD
jgi:hypothetical protein